MIKLFKNSAFRHGLWFTGWLLILYIICFFPATSVHAYLGAKYLTPLMVKVGLIIDFLLGVVFWFAGAWTYKTIAETFSHYGKIRKIKKEAKTTK